MRSTACVMVGLLAGAEGFSIGSPAAVQTRMSSPLMAGDKSNNTPAKLVPKGPFGGYVTASESSADAGWIGDQSNGEQIGKFERGEDYLFFQGPAPKTAVQEDLPSLFSAENLAEMQIKPLQIGVTVVGVATFAAVGSVLIS